MNWLWNNLDLVLELSVEHLRLSLPPIILGFIVSVPLGWLAYRYKLTRGLVLTLAGLLYTIPSLALFVLLPPLLGISFLSELNVLIALTIYAVALMTRSVADGLASVDPIVRESATAVGYSPWRRFFSVELPLAGPVLLAGLRVVAVSTVSLVTVGVFVGVRSLGFLFTNGLQRGIIVEIVTGIVMTVVIALILDGLLVLLGRLVLPWTRLDARARRRIPVTTAVPA
ncbi:ABC transporter permease [Cryobacterium sp. BB307]|uniref:ABC transporter permease subunit n=1 Tax=Cryobacterium sp. BB307 TaxID=2716317 RepID=UPI0014468CFF